MRQISKLLYMIGQGLKNIKRNRMFSLASIGTITACIFLFGIFFCILSNFQSIIKEMESSIGLTVFFEEGIGEARIEYIGDEIRSQDDVQALRYISAEEAWERAKEEMFQGKEELIETFENDNPLADSASYEVFVKDIAAQEGLRSYISCIAGVRQVKSAEGMVKGLLSANSLVGYLSAALIIILLGVSVFLISTTVTMGISVRREEISIMRLVGATDFFIRAPFVVEGVVIGCAGAALPLLGLYFIYNRTLDYVLNEWGMLLGKMTLLDVSAVFASLVPISLLMGVGIGFLGSWLTIRKHLQA